MKGCYLVPVRNVNKAGADGVSAIEKCVASLLPQDVAEIIFFDQGSTDGTKEVIGRLIEGREGARLVLCPENTAAGTNAAVNADFDFAIHQSAADYFLFCGGDDFSEPARAEKVGAAFDGFEPDWVCTRMRVQGIGGNVGETWFPNRRSGFVTPFEAIKYQIGSSGAFSFSRRLYNRHGPLVGLESNDVVLPVLAAMEGGLYFIDETLHTYVEWASVENLGTEGRLRGARSEAEREELTEQNIFGNALNWVSVYRRLGQAGHLSRLPADAQGALLEKVLGCCAHWAAVHESREIAARRKRNGGQ